MAEEAPVGSEAAGSANPAGRRDAVRNYHRVLEAAREVLGECGADASMEEIAARAGVGVGTVYRRFANKDALIDELLRLAMCEVLQAARQALACPGGTGLEQFLRALGAMFAASARYAHLLLERSASADAAGETAPGSGRADRPGAGRGHAQPRGHRGRRDGADLGDAGADRDHRGVAPETWQRFLDIHLAGLCAPGPLSASPSMSAGQLSALLPRP